jgi:recombination associated protein RdgC
MMLFKNLKVYDVGLLEGLHPSDIETMLAARAFTPCGAHDFKRSGFVPPLGTGMLTHIAASAVMVCVKTQEKVLPTAAINELLAVKVAEFTQRKARPPGRKERQGLKEQVIFEALPRALVKSRLDFAFIYLPTRRLFINSASNSACENVIHLLRQAFGSMPCTPLYGDAFGKVTDTWLRHAAPSPFDVSDGCKLLGATGREATLKGGAEALPHLEDGLRPTQIALTWTREGSLYFKLDSDLTFKGIKYDGLLQATAHEGATVAEAFDASVAICVPTLVSLVRDTLTALSSSHE